MGIICDEHLLDMMAERGTSLTEVVETIELGAPVPAHSGRQARVRVFPLLSEWKGRHYEEKEVRVVYAQEGEDIVPVTVITRFGRFT